MTAWGFAFPEDLHVVWRIARAIARTHPLDAFFDTIGVRLEGPFIALAGGKVPRDLGRWASDPPEFFTIASGDSDGLHWGYVVHDPGKSDPVCAHFRARDGYPIAIGTTLYAALRTWLVDVGAEKRAELAETVAVGEPDAELARHVAAIAAALRVFAKHRAPPAPRKPKPIAATLDGLGVVCSKAAFAPAKANATLADAEKLLAAGKPGGALRIARDVYARLPVKDQAPARAVLAAAYTALERPALVAALGSLAPAKQPKPRGPRHCGSFAEALEDLASVRSLVISYPDAGSPLPTAAHWAAMSKLERVALRGIPIALPPSFAKLPLRKLEIMNCRPAKFPRVLLGLHGLVELDLHGVRDIPDHWKLPKLDAVHIHDSNLAKVPAFIARATRLYKLGISKTAIREIELGGHRRLQYLRLANNQLRELPDVFDRLPDLSSLWIEGNRLTHLPDSIGALRGTLDAVGLGKNPLVTDKAERARIKAMLPKAKFFWT